MLNWELYYFPQKSTIEVHRKQKKEKKKEIKRKNNFHNIYRLALASKYFIKKNDIP